MKIKLCVASLGAVVLAAAVSSCSSSSGGSKPKSEGTKPSASSGSSTSADVSAAQALLSKGEAPLTAASLGVTPVTPRKNVTVGIVTAGLAAPVLKDMANATAAAAKALGWKSTIFDGQLGPSGFQNAEAQAIAQGVDVIINEDIADQAIPNQLTEAAAKHIPVVCAVCANTFVAAVKHPSKANVDSDYAKQSQLLVAYAITQTGGKAKIAYLTDAASTPNGVRFKAMKAALAACEGCKMVKSIEIGQSANLNSASQQAGQALLQQFGKGSLNYISDADTFAPGVIAALKAAGRTDVHYLGYDCNVESLQIIGSSGEEQACADTPLNLEGWAAIDQAVHLLDGQAGKNVVIPPQLVTKDHNLPASGKAVDSEFNYEAIYEKAWGVKS